MRLLGPEESLAPSSMGNRGATKTAVGARAIKHAESGPGQVRCSPIRTALRFLPVDGAIASYCKGIAYIAYRSLQAKSSRGPAQFPLLSNDRGQLRLSCDSSRRMLVLSRRLNIVRLIMYRHFTIHSCDPHHAYWIHGFFMNRKPNGTRTAFTFMRAHQVFPVSAQDKS
jgi:hypothetical protein